MPCFVDETKYASGKMKTIVDLLEKYYMLKQTVWGMEDFYTIPYARVYNDIFSGNIWVISLPALDHVKVVWWLWSHFLDPSEISLQTYSYV